MVCTCVVWANGALSFFECSSSGNFTGNFGQFTFCNFCPVFFQTTCILIFFLYFIFCFGGISFFTAWLRIGIFRYLLSFFVISPLLIQCTSKTVAYWFICAVLVSVGLHPVFFSVLCCLRLNLVLFKKTPSIPIIIFRSTVSQVCFNSRRIGTRWRPYPYVTLGGFLFLHTCRGRRTFTSPLCAPFLMIMASYRLFN